MADDLTAEERAARARRIQAHRERVRRRSRARQAARRQAELLANRVQARREQRRRAKARAERVQRERKAERVQAHRERVRRKALRKQRQADKRSRDRSSRNKYDDTRWRRYGNGRIPRALLIEISYNAYLNPQAALAWFLMRDAARAQGVYLTISPGGYAYRDLSTQHRLYRLYKAGGNLAAYPGTSNHGWGAAADIGQGYQRTWVARNGARYGWKMDVPGEAWHTTKYGSGHR